MRGWLLDTNVIAEMSGAMPDPRVRRWIQAQRESTLFLSILTLAEYDKGIHHLPDTDVRRPRLQAAVAALEARFHGRVLPLSDTAVRKWGVMSGQIKRATGHSPGVVDTLLAATAAEQKIYFATRNTRDVIRCDAVLFNPWQDDASRFPVA